MMGGNRICSFFLRYVTKNETTKAHLSSCCAMLSPSKNVTDDALSLIVQLQRNPDVLPPYNDDVMKKCIAHINALYTQNFDDLTALRGGSCGDEAQRTETVRARQSCIDFIKRCCCAYVNNRMERIKSLRWKHGGVLPANIKANLHEAEIEWLNEYNSMLAEFQGSFGENGVNLMTNLKPPKSLFIEVRAIEDYGEFETSDGTVVMLKKNSLHSLPRQDCEMLIKQGILEIAHS
uniref:DNA replication complex GINS protein PSF1 n=1 Tax=Ascaris suum TaxID=6253 RepID=F1LCR0_ASCSU